MARWSAQLNRRFEDRIRKLGASSTEADLTLYHPMRPSGYSDTIRADDNRYLRYVAASLGAVREVS